MLLASPQLGKLRGRLMERQPLADYTSWRVGGPADLVFIPADVDDVAEFLKHLPLDVPVTWLGLGSNVLIRDGGLDGAVIITQGALHNITPIQYGPRRSRCFLRANCTIHRAFGFGGA